MKLKYLLTEFDYYVVYGSDEIEVNALRNDSRKAGIRDVFICIKGAASDGHRFISDVIERGVAAIVVEGTVDLPKEAKNITVISVKNTRNAMALMSAAYFGYPADKLITIGITGTKGKTTTTYMIRSVLESIGIKTGLIGTIESIIGDKKTPAKNTTPESYDLHKDFAEMVEAGCRCVVMEVSSQALKYNRVDGIVFDYGIFTNLEPDHIGPNEHENFEDYMTSKSKLLRQCRQGIVNMDSDYIDEVLLGHTCEIETYGIDGDFDFSAGDISLFTKPGKLCVSYALSGKIKSVIEVDLPGIFSVYNSLCAVALCSHFTDDLGSIQRALTDIKIKGRVEMIHISDRFTLMIDYAHNAMSLESLLTSLKKYNPKRLVTVFGCGGNRSKDRRYEMGEVSSRLSDFTIVTSDNPRFEDPMDIINDILEGIERSDGSYVTIPDRKDAIRYAILNAEDGDVIILAGKGHEDYQEIKGVKYPMDERNLISDIIKEENVRRVL